MRGFDPWEGKKNGRAASFLQVSRSTCHHPRPPPPQKKDPETHTPGFRPCKTGQTQLHAFTHSHPAAHTRSRTLADTMKVPGRDNSGSSGPGVSSPLLPPDVTHVMDSQAAGERGGKLPKSPGRRGWESKGNSWAEAHEPPPPQRRDAASEPGSKGVAPLYLQTMSSAGGRGRRRRAEGLSEPPGTPLRGAPAFGAALQTRATRAPGVPIPCRRGAGIPRGVPGGKRKPLTSSSESP